MEMAKPIIIYTLEHCPKCKLLLSYLDSLKVDYETRSAQDFASFLLTQGFSAAPILEINGTLFDFKSVSSVIFILQEQGYLK